MEENLLHPTRRAPGAQRARRGTARNRRRRSTTGSSPQTPIDPADVAHDVLPAREGRVVRIRRQQEQWIGRHRAERRDLAPPQHVDARGAERREHHGEHRDEHLARQGDRRANHQGTPRPRPRRADPTITRMRSAVGVDDLADLRDLVQTTRQEAVDPVGGAERRQQPRRDRAMIGREEQPEEDRDQRETDQRDQVRPRPPPRVATPRSPSAERVLGDGDGWRPGTRPGRRAPARRPRRSDAGRPCDPG